MKRILLLAATILLSSSIPAVAQNAAIRKGRPLVKRLGPSPLLVNPTAKELKDADLADLYGPAQKRYKAAIDELLRIQKARKDPESDREERRLRAAGVRAAIAVVQAADQLDRVLFPLYLCRLQANGLDKGANSRLYQHTVSTFRAGKAGTAVALLRLLAKLHGVDVALADAELKSRLSQAGKREDVVSAQKQAIATVTQARDKLLEVKESHGLLAARKAVDTAHDAYCVLVGYAVAKPVAVLKGHPSAVGRILFHPSGRILFSNGIEGSLVSTPKYALKVWDLERGKEVLTISDAGQLIGMRPDGKRLITARPKSAGYLKYTFTICRWDPSTGAGGEAFTLKESVNCMSPDGKLLAGGSYQVQVWEAASGKPMLKSNPSGRPTAFSPDGKYLLGVNHMSLKKWEVATGKEVMSVEEGRPYMATGGVFSPDGKRLLSQGLGDEVRMRDASGLVLHTLAGHGSVYGAMTFSPDGKKIATAGMKNVKVWDVATGECLLILTGNTDAIYGLAFSPDGRRLASAGGLKDRAVRVWELLE